jgi:tetratricopeptide (TPR) repeat protein
MMKDTVDIVRRELAAGKSQQEMEKEEIFAAYEQYAGSYVSANGWINKVIDALTVPRETRNDICKPVYKAWKQDGAKAAVERYRHLLATNEEHYDFSQYVLIGIGANLYSGAKYDDAVIFLMGSIETYPNSKYAYYAHYLSANALQKLGRIDEATVHGQASVNLNGDFEAAKVLVNELTGMSAQN